MDWPTQGETMQAFRQTRRTEHADHCAPRYCPTWTRLGLCPAKEEKLLRVTQLAPWHNVMCTQLFLVPRDSPEGAVLRIGRFLRNKASPVGFAWKSTWRDEEILPAKRFARTVSVDPRPPRPVGVH